MKRITAIVLVFALALCLLCGCGKYFFPEKEQTPSGGGQQEQPGQQPEQSGEGAEGGEQQPETPPDILSDHQIEELCRAAACFTVAPQEFTDPSQLTDDAKLYAALLRGDSEFLSVAGDEYTYYLPYERLAGLVEEVFGRGVAIDGPLTGNYYPYEIDLSAGRIYRHSESIDDIWFYTESATQTADGQYLLRLINLSDPLFLQKYEDYLYEGREVTQEMIDEFGGQLFTYVYTLQQQDNGYIITAFSYENYKDLTAGAQ